MAITAAVVKSGESVVAATAVTFAAQTAGKVLVLVEVGDDYAVATPPTGWTTLWLGNKSGAFHVITKVLQIPGM